MKKQCVWWWTVEDKRVREKRNENKVKGKKIVRYVYNEGETVDLKKDMVKPGWWQKIIRLLQIYGYRWG